MNGYERRTKQKKEAILNAARELFFGNGVKETTISDICRKAKVSQGSLYNYGYSVIQSNCNRRGNLDETESKPKTVTLFF